MSDHQGPASPRRTGEDAANRFRQLQDHARDHPGRMAHGRWNSLGMVAHMVNANRNELLALFDAVEQNDDVQTALFGRDTEMETAVYSQLYRLLHNYLAAVKTMVDHSRNLVKHYDGSDFQEQYEGRVKHIAHQDVAAFIQDLRNVVLHHELPGLGTQFKFVQGAQHVVMVTLHKRSLLESKRWSVRSRQYIAAQDDSFSIRQCVNEYADLAESLSAWLRDQFLVLHEGDLAEHNALVEESRGLLPPELMPGPINDRLGAE